MISADADRAAPHAIRLDRVVKVLGKVKRIDALSLSCEAGSICGLIGPNGSGKTTLLNLMTGLYRPDGGTVRIAGFDPVGQYREVRRRIGLLPQETALYPELSARQNLEFHGALYCSRGIDVKRRIGEVLELVDLTGRGDEPVRNFSGGMKRRLGIGRALLSDPQILFFDEPTLGVDVQSSHRIWEYIRALGEQGKTVIVTTNIMSEAEVLCDRIFIVDDGRNVCDGTPQELKAAVGASTIEIRLDPRVGIPDDRLRTMLGAHTVAEDGTITVAAPHEESDLVALIQRAGDPSPFESVSLKKPTLDDVFLHHTGKRLRD